MEHGLHARFAHVADMQKAVKEAKTAKDVPSARERVSAELGFVTYVEGLRQAAHGGPANTRSKATRSWRRAGASLP